MGILVQKSMSEDEKIAHGYEMSPDVRLLGRGRLCVEMIYIV